MAVLESAAEFLKGFNRKLVAVSKSFQSTSLNQQQNSAVPLLQSSCAVCRRVLLWIFSALANLDALQAVDADVSYILQVVRRCCRWMKGTVIVPTADAAADAAGAADAAAATATTEEMSMLFVELRLIEIIIQDFFHQR